MAHQNFLRSTFLLLLLIGLTACSRTEHWGPGVVAPDEPIQTSSDRDDWIDQGYSVHPMAEFTVRARVLSKTRYSSGLESKFSPEDLALGWGRMSDESVFGKLDITQSGRWYHYQWGPEGPPIPLKEIIDSSANMHMVPADENVAILIKDVKVGQVVTLKGFLITIRGPNWWWKSSMTRKDSGDGACELVWVESVEAEDPPATAN